jgi:hypothetical protein
MSISKTIRQTPILKIIKQEIFYFLSILLAAFIVLEVIWPNIILVYLNLNWLLVLWLISGITLLIKK